MAAGRPSKFPKLPGVVHPFVRGLLFKRMLRKAAFPKAKTNKAMDPASVTGTTFFLTPEGGGAPVPATITGNAPGTSFTLDPTDSLRRNARYQAAVTTGVRDAGGTQMAATQTWTFRTGNR